MRRVFGSWTLLDMAGLLALISQPVCRPSVLRILPILIAIAAPAHPTSADDSVNCKVRAVFPSQSSIGEALSEEIRTTQSKLLLSLYSFNNPALADELVKLAKRGIKVAVKIDAAKSREEKEVRLIKRLKSAGISVQAVAADGRNHNKFAILDDSKIITGSYNWTLKAESNFENLLILVCPQLVHKYRAEWDAIR
jgi:phospholipase D